MPSTSGLAFAAFVTMAAAGERPPTYNVEATCRAAPTLGVGNGKTDRNCIRDETQARMQIGQYGRASRRGVGRRASRKKALEARRATSTC